MLKRRWSLIVAVAVIILALFLKNVLSRQKNDPPRTPDGNRLRAVATMGAQGGDVQIPVRVAGKLRAMERMELYAEVQGILMTNTKVFREGVSFAAGETMLRVDDKELRMNLAALKGTMLNSIVAALPDMKIDMPEVFAKWQLFLSATDIEKPLPPLPEFSSEKEKYFIASRNIITQYYNIAAQQVRLEKHAIRAPYTGIVSSALINEGTLVRVGQKLGEFVSSGVYELEAGIASEDLNMVTSGALVELHSDDTEGGWKGVLARINPSVDPTTQTVRVYIKISGSGLREGMFLSGIVEGRKVNNAIELPRNLLHEYNTVFVVENGALQAVEVAVIHHSGNNMIVTGIPDGARIVTEIVPGGHVGMKVMAAE